jgi:uncharacterized protein
MQKIKIERNPDRGRLEEMSVFNWPIWEKAPSRFDWYYDSKETCYLLEGKVKVEPEDQEAVEFGAGDLVVFPEGMKCVWEITEKVRKHYKFG